MFVKKDNCRTIEEVVRRNTGMETEQFLTDVRDPFLKNLKEAVEFVKNYISSHPGCRVTIVGDYDSDGINATTIMYWCFMKMKITPVLRLPRRMSEGYGLNEKIIDEIPSGLLITVDNGIAALAAVKKAKEKNLAVVVTDHHLPVQDKDGNMLLPEADVILDPHIDSESDFHDYCGAALAYRFARAMFGAKFPELIVLASIAAVSDVVPLIGANRTLVKDGLGYINKRRVVPGLAELLKKLELDDHITEGDYGFLLGPIFNASGRLFDSGAENVVKLLCTKRGDFTAKYKADKLIATNNKRKEIVRECMKRVEEEINPKDRPIVVYDPSIPEGIVGIIAGKLAEEYYTPAIVFTDCGKEGVIKGSGRTISEIHLKNTLNQIQDEMLGFGGHAGAAGLSIRRDNLETFTKAFRDACGEIPDPPKDFAYDLELDIKDLPGTIEELKRFAPYGEQNPQVKFHATFDIDPLEFRVIGDGTHFMVKTDNDITIFGFGLTEKFKDLNPERIECVGTLTENWFNGKSSLRFELIDFEPAE